MKRYIRNGTIKNGVWEKLDKNTYNLYLGDEWLATAYKHEGNRLWEVHTNSFASYENSLAEAKRRANYLIEQEANGIVNNMESMMYSQDEMRAECETNPYLKYMGVIV